MISLEKCKHRQNDNIEIDLKKLGVNWIQRGKDNIKVDFHKRGCELDSGQHLVPGSNVV